MTEDPIHKNTVQFTYYKKIPGYKQAEDSNTEQWTNSNKHKLTVGDINVMVNGAEVEDGGKSSKSELKTINHSGVAILEAALSYTKQ